jgi:murein DD-endopeptidase MepM/ murein hydrolase activator NlpD
MRSGETNGVASGGFVPPLDLAVRQDGAAAYAAGAGKATLYPDPGSTYGNHTVIDHGTYGRTLYAHLAGFSIANGAMVDQNTLAIRGSDFGCR